MSELLVETLYRTKTPQIQGCEQHFEVVIGEESVAEQMGYYVREFHCWQDQAGKGLMRVQYTLSPRGGFPTIEQALARYEAQKLFRARRGYFHCYAPRFGTIPKCRYSKIDIPADPVKPQEEPEKPAPAEG
ncbi:MAG TPA: hypothetical protein VKV39_04900 [Candidatus Sulfotelmatobacter sp.]|nr:hypothetical protein [Candidatus Sulfotelmatobacter sp.]